MQVETCESIWPPEQLPKTTEAFLALFTLTLLEKLNYTMEDEYYIKKEGKLVEYGWVQTKRGGPFCSED